MTQTIQLGQFEFTKDEIIDRATKQLLAALGYEDDGGCDDDYNERILDRVRRETSKVTKEAIEKAVEKISSEILAPTYERIVREAVIQETTSYGEKKGRPMSFLEFLESKVVEYLKDEVDKDGCTREQRIGSGYSFNKAGDRLSVAVKNEFRSVVAEVSKDLVSRVLAGMQERVRVAVNDALAGTLSAAITIGPEKKP